MTENFFLMKENMLIELNSASMETNSKTKDSIKMLSKHIFQATTMFFPNIKCIEMSVLIITGGLFTKVRKSMGDSYSLNG